VAEKRGLFKHVILERVFIEELVIQEYDDPGKKVEKERVKKRVERELNQPND